MLENRPEYPASNVRFVGRWDLARDGCSKALYSTDILTRKIGTDAKANMEIAIRIIAMFGANHKKGTLAINATMLPIIVYDNNRYVLK